MSLPQNILYDPATETEIIFSRPDGTIRGCENNVIDYIRKRDNKLVSHCSSSGVREIKFEMETTATAAMERTLDHFRDSGKSLLLFLPQSDFASEVVLKEVFLIEQIRTTQVYAVSAYCYGVEGMCMLGNDPRTFWVTTTTPDIDAISGNVITLATATHYTSIPQIPVDDVYFSLGNYTMWVRAKSSAGTTNDLRLGMDDTSIAGDIAVGYSTVLASAYKWYPLNVTVSSANQGHTITSYAWKETAATNSLYIDVLAFVQASGLITV